MKTLIVQPTFKRNRWSWRGDYGVPLCDLMKSVLGRIPKCIRCDFQGRKCYGFQEGGGAGERNEWLCISEISINGTRGWCESRSAALSAEREHASVCTPSLSFPLQLFFLYGVRTPEGSSLNYWWEMQSLNTWPYLSAWFTLGSFLTRWYLHD